MLMMAGTADLPLRLLAALVLLLLSTTLTPSSWGPSRTPGRGLRQRSACPHRLGLMSPIFPRFGLRHCGRNGSGSGGADLDSAHDSVRLPSHEIDTQQAVTELGGLHLDALGQHERAAELASSDAAVDEFTLLVLFLAAANDEL